MPNLSAARGVGHIVSDDTLLTGPAGVAEVADATDLKSVGTCVPCGFESHPRHHGFGGEACSGLKGRAGAAATRVVSRRNSSGTTWPASVHDAGRGPLPVPLRGSIFQRPEGDEWVRVDASLLPRGPSVRASEASTATVSGGLSLRVLKLKTPGSGFHSGVGTTTSPAPPTTCMWRWAGPMWECSSAHIPSFSLPSRIGAASRLSVPNRTPSSSCASQARADAPASEGPRRDLGAGQGDCMLRKSEKFWMRTFAPSQREC